MIIKKNYRNFFVQMLTSSWLFVILLSFPSGAKAASGAYIPNVNDNTLSRINLSTNTVTATISVGNGPWAMARAGTGMYVTISNDDAVYVIDVTKDEVIRTITGAGDRPVGITINGTGAYVVNEYGGTVTIIDTTNFQVERTITVGLSPIGIAISGTGAYVANSDSDTVSLIDITKNLVVRTISMSGGSFPWYIAISGTGVYVTNGRAGQVTVIDSVNGNVERTIPVGNSPRGITIKGTGAYVANLGGDTVSLIDIGRNIVAKTISVGSGPIGIGTSGTGVYVSNYNVGTVSVIDTTDNVVERTITAGGGAQHPGFFLETASSSSSSSSTNVGGGGVASWVIALRLQNGLNADGTPKSTSSSSSVSSSMTSFSSASASSRTHSSDSLFPAANESFTSSSQNAQSSTPAKHERIVTQKGIVLKDVWADDWFGSYVKHLVDLNIFEGYKDMKGEPLGLYGPADFITMGQLAKVGDLLSGQVVIPVSGNDWAIPYVAAAKAANLSVFQSTVDPKKSASRGAVIQTILEAFETPMTAKDTSMYSDVPADAPYAAAIATATKLGIVSGDEGRTTFRPNTPINRAEVAKMIILALGFAPSKLSF